MKHFTLDEFACRHCRELPDQGMHPDLLAVLDLAREKTSSPIHITSGYRCPAHNANTPGAAPDSYHTKAMAADSWCEGLDVYAYKELLHACMKELGLQGGLQEYPDAEFVHVDVRGYWAQWC